MPGQASYERFIGGNAPVVKSDQTISACGQLPVVRDEHEGGALGAVQLDQYVENVFPVGTVEIAGGLVSQYEWGPTDEGSGERHTLLFTPGKLHRIVVESVGEADTFQQPSSSPSARETVPGQVQRQQHVLFGRQRGNQLVGLENKADLASTQYGHIVFGEILDFLSVKNDLPG